MQNEFLVHNLERHETKDTQDSHPNGELTVIWRDWDNIINNPKMVYMNTINGKEVKGPHIHQKRTSYFYCIEGEIILVIKDNAGKYHEVKTNSEKSESVSEIDTYKDGQDQDNDKKLPAPSPRNLPRQH